MALYDRLLGLQSPNIEVHAFYSLMAERRRGNVTSQQVIDAFALTAPEQTELSTLVARAQANAVTGPEIHEVLMIGRAGIAPYNSVAAVKARFGV